MDDPPSFAKPYPHQRLRPDLDEVCEQDDLYQLLQRPKMYKRICLEIEELILMKNKTRK